MKTPIALTVVALLAGCGGGGAAAPDSVPTSGVVLIGDSITYCWDTLACTYQTPDTLLSAVLPGVIDKGIGGQTCQQMQARFAIDVLALRPAIVVILCGTNDIRYNTDGNQAPLFAMVEAAQSTGARVIVGTLPPDAWTDGYPATDQALYDIWNATVRVSAASYGYSVADYYTAMLAPDGKQNASLFRPDGTHPNPAGYSVMWGVLKTLL